MDAFKQTSACPTDSVVSIKARHAEPVPNAHKTPAPGAYTIPGGIGEKAGVYKRAKGGRFGKERRGQDPEDREKACKPGPKYSLGSTMGRQMLSTRPGSPATKMGGRYNISPKVDESFTCRADSFLRPSSSPNAPYWSPHFNAHPRSCRTFASSILYSFNNPLVSLVLLLLQLLLVRRRLDMNRRTDAARRRAERRKMRVVLTRLAGPRPVGAVARLVDAYSRACAAHCRARR